LERIRGVGPPTMGANAKKRQNTRKGTVDCGPEYVGERRGGVGVVGKKRKCIAMVIVGLKRGRKKQERPNRKKI